VRLQGDELPEPLRDVRRSGGARYRELPLRIADFGRLHRYERSGVVHGLTRVRTFSQDDAHIFCTPEQMQDEISAFNGFFYEVYDALAFDKIEIKLATAPREAPRHRRDVGPAPRRRSKVLLDEKKLAYIISRG
jgi:threonyl-tRNA synthetase